jgi:hypothetical protein
VVRLAGRGQICPLVWEKPRRVLVGDDQGYLTCWDADTGKPRALLVRREQSGLPDAVVYPVPGRGVLVGQPPER